MLESFKNNISSTNIFWNQQDYFTIIINKGCFWIKFKKNFERWTIYNVKIFGALFQTRRKWRVFAFEQGSYSNVFGFQRQFL
jgi:hypothetical protein